MKAVIWNQRLSETQIDRVELVKKRYQGFIVKLVVADDGSLFVCVDGTTTAPWLAFDLDDDDVFADMEAI